MKNLLLKISFLGGSLLKILHFDYFCKIPPLGGVSATAEGMEWVVLLGRVRVGVYRECC